MITQISISSPQIKGGKTEKQSDSGDDEDEN
jgi:hypothetical protein